MINFHDRLIEIYNCSLYINASLIFMENQAEILSKEDAKDLRRIKMVADRLLKFCENLSNKSDLISFKELYSFIKISDKQNSETTKYLNLLTFIVIILTSALIWEAYTDKMPVFKLSTIEIRIDLIFWLLVFFLFIVLWFFRNDNESNSANRLDIP